MVGSFVAEDADTRYEDVKEESVQISGNPEITYALVNTGQATVVPTRVRIENYRRVK